MVNKYKKKFLQENPLIYCGHKKKRDGNWYAIYEIPLCLSEEAIKNYWLEIIGSDFMMRKEWYEKGYRMRKYHGELSGLKDKLEKRDKLAKEIKQREISKGTSKILIPDIIIKELRKRKLLAKDELSDRQIRRITRSV